MNLIGNNDIDIALIQPLGWGCQNPPLGLALLKSYLLKNGFKAKVFDLNIIIYNLRHGNYRDVWDLSKGYYIWEKETILQQMFSYYSKEILSFIYTVLSFNPKVIGFSTHCSSFMPAVMLAEKVKKYSPETKLVFGGPHVASYTSNWQPLLSSKKVDAVIFGEGEESLFDYLKSDKLSPIDGAAILNKNGEVIVGGLRKLIKKLDELPFADFSDFDLKYYAGVNVLPTYFSRGCINKCIYCTENKFFPKFRNRSGKRVYDEVIHQLSLYPKTEYIRLHDSISNGNIKELETFCDLIIENKINIGFDLENAVIRREMDLNLNKKLKKAGCTIIGYGLENPSKRLLKFVGKNVCLDADFNKVISIGIKSKMIIGLNMMFGLPGETDLDFQMQIDLIKKYKKYRKYILINPALNYCYIPEGCDISSDPTKYEVDISNGGLFWSSKDGENTFIKRLNKFEKFCLTAQKYGYKNLFNIVRSVNRDEMLGNYYYNLGEYEKALDYFKKSFKNEEKNLALADSIIELYKKMSILEDSFYAEVAKFKLENNVDCSSWLNSPSTRGELEIFIKNTSIYETINRLNNFVEMLYESSSKPHFSIFGMKNYIKYKLSKFVYGTDKKYVVLVQALKEIENKINATIITLER